MVPRVVQTWATRDVIGLISSVIAVNVILQGSILLYISNQFFTNNFWQIEGQIIAWSTNLFVTCTVVGLWSCIVGPCGIMTFQIFDRCYLLIYGICLLPVIIASMTYSMQINNLTTAMVEQGGLQLFCEANNHNQVLTQQSAADLNNLLGSYVNATDQYFVPMANKWMCSVQCPCNTTAFAAYGRVPETQYNQFNRTRNQADDNDVDGTVRVQITAPTGDLDKDYFPQTFYDCYKDWLLDWNNQSNGTYGQTPEGWYAPAQIDFENMYLNADDKIHYQKYMEQIYNCTGVCSQALFKFATSPSSGLPKQTCINAQLQEYNNSIPTLSNSINLVAISTCLAFAIHLALYLKYKPRQFEIEYVKLYK